jgi:hypothetical protein
VAKSEIDDFEAMVREVQSSTAAETVDDGSGLVYSIHFLHISF